MIKAIKLLELSLSKFEALFKEIFLIINFLVFH